MEHVSERLARVYVWLQAVKDLSANTKETLDGVQWELKAIKTTSTEAISMKNIIPKEL